MTDAEAGVITGRVTTERGDPIAGAEIQVVGYTGSDNLGQDIETVSSGSDGVYRYDAGSGLYEVLGTAPLSFEGQTYLFDLEPVDGGCEQEMSDEGIVEDFVLRLTGLSPCNVAADPTNYLEYRGAAVQLFDGLTGSYGPGATIEFVLEPTGPLADGSPGETLTLRRTVEALSVSAGPIESTWILHDIPLATYDTSAFLVGADGARVPLLLALDFDAPAERVSLTFFPRVIVGTLSVGYVMPQLTVSDAAGG